MTTREELKARLEKELSDSKRRKSAKRNLLMRVRKELLQFRYKTTDERMIRVLENRYGQTRAVNCAHIR